MIIRDRLIAVGFWALMGALAVRFVWDFWGELVYQFRRAWLLHFANL